MRRQTESMKTNIKKTLFFQINLKPHQPKKHKNCKNQNSKILFMNVVLDPALQQFTRDSCLRSVSRGMAVLVTSWGFRICIVSLTYITTGATTPTQNVKHLLITIFDEWIYLNKNLVIKKSKEKMQLFINKTAEAIQNQNRSLVSAICSNIRKQQQQPKHQTQN